MIITNTRDIPGREIKEVIGIVQGNVVGTKKIEASVIEALKSAFSSALSWGPKIVTGQALGIPDIDEEEKDKKGSKPGGVDKMLLDYSNLLHQLRELALEKLEEEAVSKGADAVVNVKFGVDVFMLHTFEVYAYGTAVKLA